MFVQEAASHQTASSRSRVLERKPGRGCFRVGNEPGLALRIPSGIGRAHEPQPDGHCGELTGELQGHHATHGMPNDDRSFNGGRVEFSLKMSRPVDHSGARREGCATVARLSDRIAANGFAQRRNLSIP